MGARAAVGGWASGGLVDARGGRVVFVSHCRLALAAGWGAEQARTLAFATLLASQPVLLLSMRSPHRPLWGSGRRWTRTLTVVIVVIAVTTVAVVHLVPLAELLKLTPFPPAAGAVVLFGAATMAWSEPLKRHRVHDGSCDVG